MRSELQSDFIDCRQVRRFCQDRYPASLINDEVGRKTSSLFHFPGRCQPDRQRSGQVNRSRGHVAFLGGPLHFLSELKAALIRTLHLTDEGHCTSVANSICLQLWVPLNYKADVTTSIDELIRLLSSDIKDSGRDRPYGSAL